MTKYLYAVVVHELFYNPTYEKYEWVLGRVVFHDYDNAKKYMVYPSKCFDIIKQIAADCHLVAQIEDPIINIELIDLMD